MITKDTPIFSPSATYCTLDWFKTVLSRRNSPAVGSAAAIYGEFMGAGFNLEIALGQFAAESAYGTAGYAKTTLSWGNQLYASWLSGHATPYAPGNGYTYAKFASWSDGVTYGYVPLMNAYRSGGYTTLYTMTAHWLGAVPGSPRHLTYLNNILNAASANAQLGGVGTVTLVTEHLYPEGIRLVNIPPGSTINGYDPANPGAAVKTGTWPTGSSMHSKGQAWVSYPGNTNPPVPKGGPFEEIVDGVYANLLVVSALVQVIAPPPPQDTTPFTQADIDAAVAAQKASDDAACAANTQPAIDAAVAATKASAKVAVVFE